jgi:hypothetical protein
MLGVAIAYDVGLKKRLMDYLYPSTEPFTFNSTYYWASTDLGF